MSGYNRRLGQYGEELASQFLIKRGCLIIAKNFHTQYGEIDLIARSGDEILFIEVKTRTTSSYGYPETAVTAEKIRHITQTAQDYLQKYRINAPWRIEIISVEIDKNKKIAKIRKFELDY